MSRNLTRTMLAAFKADGEDHVRVNIRANTYIGRQLSPDYCYEYFIPNVGTFTSAKCFANWLLTGDDSKRSDSRYNAPPTVRNSLLYKEAVVYGKLHQLCATRPRNLENLINLPFVSYNIYPGGVVEGDRWTDYASRVKEVLEHYLEHGPKVPFAFNPSFLEEMKQKIKEISQQYKDLVDSTATVKVDKPKPKRKKKKQQPTMTPEEKNRLKEVLESTLAPEVTEEVEEPTEVVEEVTDATQEPVEVTEEAQESTEVVKEEQESTEVEVTEEVQEVEESTEETTEEVTGETQESVEVEEVTGETEEPIENSEEERKEQ